MFSQNLATTPQLRKPQHLFSIMITACVLMAVGAPSKAEPLGEAGLQRQAASQPCEGALQNEKPSEGRHENGHKPTVLAILSPDEVFITRSNNRRNSQRVFFGDSEQAAGLTRTYNPNDPESDLAVKQLLGDAFAEAIRSLENKVQGLGRHWVRLSEVWPLAFPKFDNFQVARLAVNLKSSENGDAQIIESELLLMNPGDTEGRAVEVPDSLLDSLYSLARAQMKLAQPRSTRPNTMRARINTKTFFVEVLVGHPMSSED